MYSPSNTTSNNPTHPKQTKTILFINHTQTKQKECNNIIYTKTSPTLKTHSNSTQFILNSVHFIHFLTIVIKQMKSIGRCTNIISKTPLHINQVDIYYKHSVYKESNYFMNCRRSHISPSISGII